MKEYKLIVGNDNGNSEHDIVINGSFVGQPNVYAKLSSLPMMDELNPVALAEDIHNNLIVSIVSNSCPVGTYYVGNYALMSGLRLKNMEVGVDNDKVNSDVVIINTLSHIAGYAAAKAFREDRDNCSNIQVIVDMTTQLPVTQYSNDAAKKLKEKFEANVHTVKVHLGTTAVTVEIKFDYVKVLPESVSAVFFLQTAPFGLIAGKDGAFFKDKRILHCGIGEGTTEYPLTEDIAFNPNFISGSDNGVGHAIEKAIRSFAKDVGIRSYSRQDYSRVLRDPLHKYNSRANEHIEEPLEGEAEEILKNLKSEIEKANNEVDIIFVHGGGSILMREHLEPKLITLCNRGMIDLIYIPEDLQVDLSELGYLFDKSEINLAVALEALGLYEFAKSDLFDALKYKATGKDAFAKSDI